MMMKETFVPAVGFAIIQPVRGCPDTSPCRGGTQKNQIINCKAGKGETVRKFIFARCWKRREYEEIHSTLL